MKKEESAVLNDQDGQHKGSNPSDSSVISIAQLLDFVNKYFPDILPKDVYEHYGHTERPSGELGEHAQYQERVRALDDREVLEYAADKLNTKGLTPGESSALEMFKARLAKLRGLEAQKAATEKRYKELKEAGNGEGAKEAYATVANYKRQIRNAEAQLLKVEETEVMKRILKEARDIVEEEEQIRGREKLERYRTARMESADRKKYRERIRKDATEVMGWAAHPSGKNVLKRVPDALKESVLPFLSAIDFTSKRQLRGGEPTKADVQIAELITKVKRALDRSRADIEYLLPENFADEVGELAENIREFISKNDGEFVINQMTADELKSLSKVVRTLKKLITEYNRLYGTLAFSTVSEAAEDSINHLHELAPSKNTSTVSEYLLWDVIRPTDGFERFGKGGKAIFEGFKQGQAKLAFSCEEIMNFANTLYTRAEVRAWEREVHSIEIDGDTVRMSTAQIMSLYELQKRPDARKHLLEKGEGIRIVAFEKGKASDSGHRITQKDIDKITSLLSEKQKTVADAIQKYMATKGAELGNEISVTRFGEKLFTDEHYFPISVDKGRLNVNADKSNANTDLYALLNVGFTKEIDENAKNRMVITGIFDVFADHMSKMAQYNAFALPVINALKWINYKTDTTDLRSAMATAYGRSVISGSEGHAFAEQFVLKLIKSANGTEAQGEQYDTRLSKGLRNANIARLAFNLRVAIQQPTAIVRAANVISFKSILQAISERTVKTPSVKNDADIIEMEQHSGIAKWKALGFYDVNVSKDVRTRIKQDTNIKDDIIEKGMAGAEYADRKTWGTIWRACKHEVQQTQHLSPNDPGFYDAVTQLFEDVIYKTQVVDSVFCKNQFLRSKSLATKMLGNFMSEPMTSAARLIVAGEKFNADIRRGLSAKQALTKNGKMLTTTVSVYMISSLFNALAQSIVDALRDDDDYETYSEKYVEALEGNLIDELMMFNKIPIGNEAYQIVKEAAGLLGADTYGYEQSPIIMQWSKYLLDLFEVIGDGKDTKHTTYSKIYKGLQSVGELTGLPIGAATRTVAEVWNNTVGQVYPELKLKQYDAGDKGEIKYAYKDGYLTEEEATKELLSKGIADDENEAYFMLKSWKDTSDSYSRFSKINGAVLTGKDTEEAKRELLEHGYTEKDIQTEIKTQIRQWYKGKDSEKGVISKKNAEKMLIKHCGMTTEAAKALVTKWSCKVVTGIEYNDIKDKYIAGEITFSRMIDMYVMYGGMTREEAREKAMLADFIKKNPKLSDITVGAVAGYNEYCKEANVSAALYYKAWKYKKSELGIDSKAKVLKYINSLALTRTQKTAVYYALGYSKSTLDIAPWY